MDECGANPMHIDNVSDHYHSCSFNRFPMIIHLQERTIPLHLASEIARMDLVTYLVEHCNSDIFHKNVVSWDVIKVFSVVR